MNKITPCLWFDDNGEEAMNYYMAIFQDGKINNANRGPDGKLFTASFEVKGQEFMILNGGPDFKFNEAVSFFVNCEDQAEVDALWEKFIADGGEESMCGWLKDKFGLSWQIVPKNLGDYIGGPDPEKAGRAMQAMLQMHKLDIAALKKAYDGE